MAPKKSSKPKLDDAAISDKDREAAETSRRLQEAALHAGIYARTRRLTGKELKPSAVLLKADGKDIVKKSSVRKGRYLLNINAQLAPAAAGRLGSLAQLDTKNPVMYLDFPHGRLKFFGTLVFPKNKYLGLKFGPKEVLCEDAFESMVVFAESWWIGTAEENPTEQQLPMPAELQTVTLHDEAADELLGSAAAAGISGGSKRPTPDEEEDPGDSGDGGGEGEGDATGAGPSSQRPLQAAAAGKRPRYNEDGDGNSSTSDSDNEDGDVPPPRKLPRNGMATPATQRKLPPAPKAARKAGVGGQGVSSGGKSEEPQDAAKAKQSKLGSFITKVPGSAAAGVSSKRAACKTGVGSQGGLPGAGPASTTRSTPRRAAAALAATKLAPTKENGSEMGDEDEGDDDDEVIQISSGSEKSSPVVNKRAKRRLAMSQVETDESESEESEPSSGNEDSD